MAESGNWVGSGANYSESTSGSSITVNGVTYKGQAQAGKTINSTEVTGSGQVITHYSDGSSSYASASSSVSKTTTQSSSGGGSTTQKSSNQKSQNTTSPTKVVTTETAAQKTSSEEINNYYLNTYGITQSQYNSLYSEYKSQNDRYTSEYKAWVQEHGTQEDKDKIAKAEAKASEDSFQNYLSNKMTTQQNWGTDGTSMWNAVGNSGVDQSYYNAYTDSLKYKTTSQGNINAGATISLGDGVTVSKQYLEGYGEYYLDNSGNAYQVDSNLTQAINKAANVYSYSSSSGLDTSSSIKQVNANSVQNAVGDGVSAKSYQSTVGTLGSRTVYDDNGQYVVSNKDGSTTSVPNDFWGQFTNNLSNLGNWIASGFSDEAYQKFKKEKDAANIADSTIISEWRDEQVGNAVGKMMNDDGTGIDPSKIQNLSLGDGGGFIGAMLAPVDLLVVSNRMSAGDTIGNGEGQISYEDAGWAALDAASLAATVFSAGGSIAAKASAGTIKGTAKALDAAGDVSTVTKAGSWVDDTKAATSFGDAKNGFRSADDLSDISKGAKSTDVVKAEETLAKSEKALNTANNVRKTSSIIGTGTMLTSGVLAGSAIISSLQSNADLLNGDTPGTSDTPGTPGANGTDESVSQADVGNGSASVIAGTSGSGGSGVYDENFGASESGGGLSDIIEQIAEIAKNYGPYIVVGICIIVVVIILLKGKTGTKTPQKKSKITPKKYDATMFGGVDYSNY